MICTLYYIKPLAAVIQNKDAFLIHYICMREQLKGEKFYRLKIVGTPYTRAGMTSKRDQYCVDQPEERMIKAYSYIFLYSIS